MAYPFACYLWPILSPATYGLSFHLLLMAYPFACYLWPILLPATMAYLFACYIWPIIISCTSTCYFCYMLVPIDLHVHVGNIHVHVYATYIWQMIKSARTQMSASSPQILIYLTPHLRGGYNLKFILAILAASKFSFEVWPVPAHNLLLCTCKCIFTNSHTMYWGLNRMHSVSQ